MIRSIPKRIEELAELKSILSSDKHRISALNTTANCMKLALWDRGRAIGVIGSLLVAFPDFSSFV